ncbi:MAG: hypothetical protein JWN28_183 [Candidatus Saccharibacteria bacterium]|nr:hypothetical protein [Candidatus Saccharibacteria bacterium]
MTTYKAEIEFKSFLNEEDLIRLNSETLELLFDPNITQHKLFFKFDCDESGKDAAANNLMKNYLGILCVYLQCKIEEFRLISITNVSSPVVTISQYLQMTSNSMIRLGPLSDTGVERLTAALNNVQDVNNYDFVLIDMYRMARAAESNVEAFWLYYAALLTLVTNPNRDRPEVNSWLINRFPNDTVHNDHFNQNVNIAIAVRDTLSHVGATFSGETLNITESIMRANNQMSIFLREKILSQLENGL